MASSVVGCSAGNEPSGGSGGASGGAGGGSGANHEGGGFAVGGGGGGNTTPNAIGHLTGKVVAPEGTIPISGALVYLSPAAPEAIPDQVYCDTCISLSPVTPYAFSNADGTFDLPVYSEGSFKIVTQKGAFRRVRDITAAAGTAAVPQEVTRLPSRTDKAAGDDIPKMAIRIGQWDAIEDTLEKLGIASDAFDRFEYSFPPNPNDPLSPDKLFNDYATLSKYHIVFVPCSGSSGTTCDDYTTSSGTVKSNIQNFVASGGKLYVTDYSYDFVRQPFPDYVDWSQQTNEIGSACLTGEYTAPAVVHDQGLTDWLAAQGITNFDVEANWTMIDAVNPVMSTDVDNNPVTVTPKVWVGAAIQGEHPSTISFERQCGRVLFSTYHTEGTGGSGLLPQERALLYVLLEVAVCVEDPTPQ
ncbi:MAG: hypothetical protein U0271_15415 [Polyangiaceae bacterium]